jgi:hypothetical protein
MKEYFYKNGLFVLRYNTKVYPKDMLQGELEVYYTSEGKKFYRFIDTRSDYYVYITDEIIEPLYGCTVVDYRPAESDNDTPVYMVYLSKEMASFKRGVGSAERYWILINGYVVAEVPKELLLYYNLIPGVSLKKDMVAKPPKESLLCNDSIPRMSLETYMVAKPPQIPEDVKKKLLTVLNE